MNHFETNTPVADWIRHLTSNQINAGSIPARGAKTKKKMAKDIKNKSKNTPNANSDNLHEDQEKNDRQLFFDESHKETIQIQIQEVSKFTRYWSLIEENSMALGIDFIDETVEESSEGTFHSLWDQLVILVFNALYQEDEMDQRESWLALGEIRFAIRQAMKLHSMDGTELDGQSFKDSFSKHIDFILNEISPDPKKLS